MLSSRVDPELVRKQLLAVLAVARGPLTTAQLREQLADQVGLHAVNEVVYRNLLVLQRRAAVRRVRPGGRHVAWQLLDLDTGQKGPR
jgi:Fe2+ or Zn2+ uptake regulation protein